MTNLDSLKIEIKDFIQNSIDRFIKENGKPNSIGIYCNPSSGWLTTNFNNEKSLKDAGNNCPDFDYVEFDLHEIPQLEEEYENESPNFEIEEKKIIHEHDLGDEHLNTIFFNYLKPILKDIKIKNSFEFLLQMLDSKNVEIIED